MSDTISKSREEEQLPQALENKTVSSNPINQMATHFLKATILGVTISGMLVALPVAANAQGVEGELAGLLQAPAQQAPLWYASTDPRGQNNDFVLLKAGETRRIPLNPGTLLRLWSTAEYPDQIDLRLQTNPNRTTPLWANGRALSGDLSDKAYTLFPSLEYESLTKLGKGAALIATNRAKTTSKWYYQASVRPDIQAMLPVLPKVTNTEKVERRVEIADGEEKQFDTRDKPGLIYELTVAVDDGSARGIFEKLRLKAAWDGQTCVDVPLMELAGQIKGTELIQNSVADYDGARLLLRWPMPFKTSQMSLVNQTGKALKLSVMTRVQDFDEEPSKVRFCALEGAARTQKGKPVEILNLKGAGAFAGLALSITPTPDSTKQQFGFLEGNETILADGKKYEGTGNEDYFSSAWYFPAKPVMNLYDGLTFKSLKPPAVSAYRLQILDALPFKRSLQFNFEQGRGNNSDDLDWKWVAFWYQENPQAAQIASQNANATQNGSAQNGGSSGVSNIDAGSDLPVGGGGNGLKITLAVVVGILIGVFTGLSKIRKRRSK